ncbi:DUF1015 domain-containing protein [Silvibacterium acidisoli]|uniref:DUF1015 domain-containing protein n=1 Tax=Acidobacteriaceae bacterium ZG23-2 TaxID=2883246 RepID=UPI00406D11B8
MAQIYPFRALRYNPSIVRVDKVVTQPYDKVSPAMQQAYYQRSPYNLIRVILGLPELFDSEQDNVYTRAAASFREWRDKGILMQEAEPCVFGYAQRFTVPGTNEQVERRGFIALGQLSDYSEKIVFRHEQTLAKPKDDRRRLLEATRAHFGQIFMLYSDPGRTAESLLFEGEAAPDIEVTDDYGVQHLVWRVNDAGTINMLTTALDDKKLIIADGHHRYETALLYAKDHAPKTPVEAVERNSYTAPQPAYPEAAVMMTFVNMDSDGLVILPTHRVVSGLADFKATDFLKKAAEFFEVETLPQEDATVLTARLASLRPQTAFVCVTREGCSLLKAKPEVMASAMNGTPDRQQRLDVSRLHEIVLGRLLGISPADILNQTHLTYVREAAEAIEQVAAGTSDVAFLMNPVTLDQLRETAFAGEVMPQKSTDFFPKLLSGLTIYALD